MLGLNHGRSFTTLVNSTLPRAVVPRRSRGSNQIGKS